MANALQTTEDKPRSVKLAEYLETKAADFNAVALSEDPKGGEKFMRIVKNAIIRDPQIAEASAQSVFLECQKAAADGLVLDGREAVLTRFKTNKRQKVGNQWQDNWQTEVVYIPMVRGLKKLVSKSPQIASWHVDLVYDEEYRTGRFRYQSGDSPRIHHEPIIVGERGIVVAAYSVVRLRTGAVHIEVMTRGQLDGIKNRTKSKSKRKVNNQEVEVITGPWATDEEEMFKKTVARRHFKSLPLEGPAVDAMERVDGLYDFERNADEEVYSAPEAPEPKAVAVKRQASAAKKLKAIAKAVEKKPAEGVDQENDPKGDDDEKVIDHDPETGELAEEREDADRGGEVDPEDEF